MGFFLKGFYEHIKLEVVLLRITGQGKSAQIVLQHIENVLILKLIKSIIKCFSSEVCWNCQYNTVQVDPDYDHVHCTFEIILMNNFFENLKGKVSSNYIITHWSFPHIWTVMKIKCCSGQCWIPFGRVWQRGKCYERKPNTPNGAVKKTGFSEGKNVRCM